MARTNNNHIRVGGEIRDRFEVAAKDNETTANQLLPDLPTHWLENRKWPRADVQTRVARSSRFTAPVVGRDMIKAGYEAGVEEIRKFMSSVVPDLRMKLLSVESSEKQYQSTENNDTQA